MCAGIIREQDFEAGEKRLTEGLHRLAGRCGQIYTRGMWEQDFEADEEAAGEPA